MFRRNTSNQDMVCSALLASIAGICSWFARTLGNGWEPEVWNVFMYIIPLAFGTRGTLVAIAISMMTGTLLVGELSPPLRLGLEMLSIALMRRAIPTFPGYLTVLMVWGAIIFPLGTSFSLVPTNAGAWSEELFFFACLQDISFSLVAGALLLNQTLWVFITERPHRNRLSEVLVHVSALCGVLTLFSVIASLNRLGVFAAVHLNASNTTAAFGLFSSLVLITSLLGYRVSLVVRRDFLSMDPSSLSSDRALRHSTETKESFFNAITNDGEFTSTLNTVPLEADRKRDGLLKGVCALDGDGTVLFMNDHFRALTDIVIPGVEGYALQNISPDSELVHRIMELFRSADPDREVVDEMRIINHDGHPQFLEISVRPHLLQNEGSDSADGKKIAPRVITLRDITDRRAIDHDLLNEKRLESLQAYARGAAESFSELLSSISEQAQQIPKEPNADSHAARESIIRDASRAQTISDQLRELSASFFSTERMRVNMSEMLRERAPLLQRMPPRDIALMLDISSVEMPVQINTALFSHAVSQLIMNAAESYGEMPGTIDLQLALEEIDEALSCIHPGTRPGRFARLRLIDSGQGMSSEVLAHAADPHFSTKDGRRHKGLGLTTVFAIMREHEGFMTIESKPGKGTCVSLYFPLLKSDAVTDHNHPRGADGDATSPEIENTSEDNKA